VVEARAENYYVPIAPGSKPVIHYDMDLTPYHPTVEPEYWKPFFKPGEMLDIRGKIQAMMASDFNPEGGYRKKPWSICNLNKKFLAPYYVPEEAKKKNNPYHPNTIDTYEPYFVFYNVLLCATLLVFGIISDKMENQEYWFTIKGGKAIQFLLEDTPNPPEYRSEDIDVLVMSTRKYHEGERQNVAAHLAQLMKWFVDMPQFGAPVSIQDPDEYNPFSNHYIYKVSFDGKFGKDDHTYKALMDIDFKEIPLEIGFIYDRPHISRVGIRPLRQNLLYISPNIDSLLNEKLFYYIKYFKYLSTIERGMVVAERYQGRLKEVTHDDCTHFMKKFSPAVLVLTEGIEKTKDKPKSISDSLSERLGQAFYSGFKLTPAEKGKIVRSLVG
jgi:hypothetical protein